MIMNNKIVSDKIQKRLTELKSDLMSEAGLRNIITALENYNVHNNIALVKTRLGVLSLMLDFDVLLKAYTQKKEACDSAIRALDLLAEDFSKFINDHDQASFKLIENNENSQKLKVYLIEEFSKAIDKRAFINILMLNLCYQQRNNDGSNKEEIREYFLDLNIEAPGFSQARMFKSF